MNSILPSFNSGMGVCYCSLWLGYDGTLEKTKCLKDALHPVFILGEEAQ